MRGREIECTEGETVRERDRESEEQGNRLNERDGQIVVISSFVFVFVFVFSSICWLHICVLDLTDRRSAFVCGFLFGFLDAE